MLCLQPALVSEHAVFATSNGFRTACCVCSRHWFHNRLFAAGIGFRTCCVCNQDWFQNCMLCLQPALVSEHAVFATGIGFRTACCVCSRHWFQNRLFVAGIGFRTCCLQPTLVSEYAVSSRHWFQNMPFPTGIGFRTGSFHPALVSERAVSSRHWFQARIPLSGAAGLQTMLDEVRSKNCSRRSGHGHTLSTEPELPSHNEWLHAWPHDWRDNHQNLHNLARSRRTARLLANRVGVFPPSF